MKYAIRLSATVLLSTLLVISTYDQTKPKYIDQINVLISYYSFNKLYISKLIHVESDNNPSAIGDDGQSIGLCQVQLVTALDYDSLATKKKLKRPIYNIHIALKHLNWLRSKFRQMGYKGSKLDLIVFSAYNLGYQGVLDRIHNGDSPINSYARKIVNVKVSVLSQRHNGRRVASN